MKKFTAIALAAVMMLLTLCVFLPVFAAENISTADALYSALSSNKDVKLTADIDLSSYNWTKVENYTKTLDGNGYTVYVPDAPLFYTLKGTVKNLNLATKSGDTMVLDDADVKDKNGNHLLTFTNNLPGDYGVGVLANYAIGATVDNVYSTANVKFAVNLNKVAAGGLVGMALSDANDAKSSFTKNTTIKNCSVSGKLNANYGAETDNLTVLGGVVGVTLLNTTVEKCAVDAEILVDKQMAARLGGIVGFVRVDGYATAGYTATSLASVEVKYCLFTGKINKTVAGKSFVAGIVGESFADTKSDYGVNITSCMNSAETIDTETDNGVYGCMGIISSSHAEKKPSEYKTTDKIKGCAVMHTISWPKSANWNVYFVTARYAGVLAEGTHLYNPSGKSLRIWSTTGGNTGIAGSSSTEYKSADEAKAGFVAANSAVFALDNNGKVTIIGVSQPTPPSTPTTNPPTTTTTPTTGAPTTTGTPTTTAPTTTPSNPTTPPTGDMSVVIMVLAVISLVSTVLIFKKKVTK